MKKGEAREKSGEDKRAVEAESKVPDPVGWGSRRPRLAGPIGDLIGKLAK